MIYILLETQNKIHPEMCATFLHISCRGSNFRDSSISVSRTNTECYHGNTLYFPNIGISILMKVSIHYFTYRLMESLEFYKCPHISYVQLP